MAWWVVTLDRGAHVTPELFYHNTKKRALTRANNLAYLYNAQAEINKKTRAIKVNAADMKG